MSDPASRDGSGSRAAGEGAAAQIVALQEAVMHLQHDLEQMHAVLLRQQRELDSLRGGVTRLDDQLDRLLQGAEPRRIEDEKPPHY